jgi:hypothetical protein
VLAGLQDLTGSHPALFEEGLQWLVDHGTLALEGDVTAARALRSHLAGSARLWQTYLPLAQEPQARERLSQLLQAPDLGRARPYLQDDDLRRLFWGNLIHVRGQGDAARLHWRSPIVREAGLAVLDACAAS